MLRSQQEHFLPLAFMIEEQLLMCNIFMQYQMKIASHQPQVLFLMHILK